MAVLVLAVPAAMSTSVKTLADLKRQWEAVRSGPKPQNFRLLIPALVSFSNQPGGRTWEVDYMLGTSYCASGDKPRGMLALNRVINGYGTTERAQLSAKQVLDRCNPSAPEKATGLEVNYVPLLEGHRETSVIHGKGGYEVLGANAPSKETVKPVQVPADELEKRLFAPANWDKAVAQATQFLNKPEGESTYTSGFVITGKQTSDNERVGLCLRHYAAPLESEFGMVLPESLITVYLSEPKNVSPVLHGVQLPYGVIAYSVAQDLSIVGMPGQNDSCGTLAHELTHLAIRQNFGDSPSWLEEGLASEVAVGRVNGNHLDMYPSWRDEELNKRWRLRPTVAQLLAANWNDYIANSSHDVERVAALHAMAACFIEYLDANDKLLSIYTGVRDSLQSPQPRSDDQVVADALGKDLAAIDADFTTWFNNRQRSRFN